jgi:plastocyanin
MGRVVLVLVTVAGAVGWSAVAAHADSSVSIAGFAFSPHTTTITAGETVTWTNHDGTDHTVTADNGAFDSTLADGQSFSFTFANPGTYAYYCRFHGAPGGVGMSGTVIVQAPATTTPATTTPTTTPSSPPTTAAAPPMSGPGAAPPPPAAASGPTTAPAGAGPQLASTGRDVAIPTIVALVMLLGGALALSTARRVRVRPARVQARRKA